MLAIRKAKPADAEDLSALYLQYLTTHPPEQVQDMTLWKQKIKHFETDEHYHLLVGEEDGRIVSSVTLVIIDNLTNNVRPYAILENVVTHGDYQKRGFASVLIRHALGIAQDAGCYKVMLMTSSKEDAIWRFYRSCGFDQNEKTAFIKRF